MSRLITSDTIHSTFSTPFYPNRLLSDYYFKIMRSGPKAIALGPDLIILNLPTIMTIEILLIECSFAIPVALPNACGTGLH